MLAQRRPDRFRQVYQNFDEWYLAFDLGLQLLFLKSQNATFAETFYRIRRITSAGGELSNAHVAGSLFCQVLLPYAYDRLLRRDAGGPRQPASPADALGRQAFAVLDALFSLANVLQKVRYASNRSTTHDLALAVCRMQSVHAPGQRSSSLLWGTLAVEALFQFGSMGLRLASIWNEAAAKKRPFDSFPVPPPPTKVSSWSRRASSQR